MSNDGRIHPEREMVTNYSVPRYSNPQYQQAPQQYQQSANPYQQRQQGTPPQQRPPQISQAPRGAQQMTPNVSYAKVRCDLI